MRAGEGGPRHNEVAMNLSCLRRLGAFVLLVPLLLPLPAWAQARPLPAPKEFYFDQDAQTARPLVLQPGSDDAVQQRLLKVMNGNGRDANLAAAQLAHIAYAGGRTDIGAALYARVRGAIGSSHRLYRPLLWNQGWDLFHAGDAEGALANWREVGAEAFGNPSWVPPTLALALWTLDRRDEAVRWYAAAVRTEPLRWNDPANLPALLPDWRAEDRATLAEVAAAWREAPPAWP